MFFSLAIHAAHLNQSIQKWFRCSCLFVDTGTFFYIRYSATRRQYIEYNRVQSKRGELTIPNKKV